MVSIHESVFVVTLAGSQSLANIIKLLPAFDLALVPALIEPAEPFAQTWISAIGDFQVGESEDLFHLVVDGEVGRRNLIGDQVRRLRVIQPLLNSLHDGDLDGVSLIG